MAKQSKLAVKIQKILKIKSYLVALLKNNTISYSRSMFAKVDSVYHQIFIDYYARSNLDVIKAKVDLISHYSTYGINEGRSPHPYFDLTHYLANNPDIASLNIDPFWHFINDGQYEYRNPSRYISARWLQYEYGGDFADPFLEISRSIVSRNYLSPNILFDTNFYLKEIGGMQELGMQTPFEHFINVGVHQGKNPSTWLDLDVLLELNLHTLNYCRTRLDAFVALNDVIENNQEILDLLVFPVKTRDDTFIQIDKQVISKLLSQDFRLKAASKDYFKNIKSTWQIIEVIKNDAKNDFNYLRKEIINLNYPPSVVKSATVTNNIGNNYLFYCHWDSKGEVADWISLALSEFHQNGFNIIFNTNLDIENLPEEIVSLCFQIHQRENSGFDFNSHLISWNEFENLKLPVDRVIFMNDSVFFPMCDSKVFFEKVFRNEYQIWGATKNSTPKPHIQSYLLVLDGEIAALYMEWVSKELNKWIYLSKSGLIATLEIQIDEFAFNVHASTGSMYEQSFFEKGNPTHSSWDKLPAANVPILKVELVRMLMRGYPGDTKLLELKLKEVFNETKISVTSILNHTRHVELSRNDVKYWYK